MSLGPSTPGTHGLAAKSWPSVALASARLCRPHHRVVASERQFRFETSAVLELAAISLDRELVAVDGSLHVDAAGTSLEIDGEPVRIHDSGTFSTAFELHARTSLVVTLIVPLDVAECELEPLLREPT